MTTFLNAALSAGWFLVENWEWISYSWQVAKPVVWVLIGSLASGGTGRCKVGKSGQ